MQGWRAQALLSAESAGTRTTDTARLALTKRAEIALFVVLAAGVALAGRSGAGFEIDAWGPLGMVLVLVAAVLFAIGRVPNRYAGAGALILVALGGWFLLSTTWGGLPSVAWAGFNQSVLAAAALVTGSMLATTTTRRQVVIGAVLAGLVVQAAEVLIRLSASDSPDGWFERGLQGPVGYTNAQGAIFALGIPLALWLVTNQNRLWRAAGGSAAGLLLGALLLTQSRGALVALVIALAAQLLWFRSLRTYSFALILVLAAGGLGLLLRDVDVAVLDGTAAEQLETLRRYALYTAGIAAVLGVLAAVQLRTAATRRGVALGLTAVVIVGAGAIAAANQSAAESVFQSTDPTTSPGGTTRLLAVGLSGRQETWRVATAMAGDNVLVGAGPGAYARQWTMDRQIPELYVQRPHSIELELLTELGIVGVAFFVAFVALSATGLFRAIDRRAAGAGLGVFAFLIAHASIDLTWSMPAIVASTLLVVGAASGWAKARAVPWPARAAVALIGVLVIMSLGAPYIADRQLEAAEAAELRDPADARRHTESALQLNPWEPAALSLQGRLAETQGDYVLAATKYREAAERGLNPWLEYFHEARALAAAGLTSDARSACLLSLSHNPGEPVLLNAPCGSEGGGEIWPVVSTPVEGTFSVAVDFDGYFRDDGCDGCSITASGETWSATVEGGPDHLDTAYAVTDFGGETGWEGVVYSRHTVRLDTPDELSGHLAVFQVRDVDDELVYEIYVRKETGTLWVWSPEGGLQSGVTNEDTGVPVASEGAGTVVEVAALANDSVVVRVDGAEMVVLNDLDGATSGPQASLRVGIIGYEGQMVETARVTHGLPRVSRGGWPG